MDQIFNVGDSFVGRKLDILNLKGVIAEIKGAGRKVQVLCRFETGEEEWLYPRDLWKDDAAPTDDHERDSSTETSSEKSSKEDSDDAEMSSDSENSNESKESSEEDDGNTTYLLHLLHIENLYIFH